MADAQDYFSLAHAFTALWEGGVSENPVDKGGLTAYGASIKFVEGIAATVAGQDFLEHIGVRLPVTRQSMWDVTPEQVRAMLRREFWDRLRLDDYPFPVSLVLYDTAVNCGCKRSVMFAQRGYNACLKANGERLSEDGKAGPLTCAALCSHVTPAVLTAILDARQAFYNELATHDPSQKAFIQGWTNRINSLRQYVERVSNGVAT